MRALFLVVTIALGSSVILMSRTESTPVLGAALTLIRGFGESSLSIVAMVLVGKWFSRRINMAMGIFAVLTAIGFVAIMLTFTALRDAYGWRDAWGMVGAAILAGGAILGTFFVRDRSATSDVARAEFASTDALVVAAERDFTYGQALRTPAFWCLAIGAPIYALAFNAVALYNEALLQHQGFAKDKSQELLGTVLVTGLLFNFLGGWIGTKISPTKLLGAVLLVLAVAFAAFPHVRADGQLAAYAAAIGAAGGVVTVVFFSAWAQLFGRANLGRIQGTAQACSVLASAAGPVLLIECFRAYGDYAPFFYSSGAVALLLGVACCVVPKPQPESIAMPSTT
ncbi:MAG: MFS transporter [Pirellulales bacterium]